MVKATFENLKAEKKERVTQALLHEFSAYPLERAQVARIVKEAGIARGAFYKYFDGLPDAYAYTLKTALVHLHAGFSPKSFDGEEIYRATWDFLKQVKDSEYYDLDRMHYVANEAAVKEKQPASLRCQRKLPAKMWAAMLFSHETIRCALLDPDHADEYLKRLKEALALIE